MKIVISVSDEIFQLSERLAQRLKVSRNKVFETGVEKLAKSLDNELENGKTNISRKRMTRNRIESLPNKTGAN